VEETIRISVEEAVIEVEDRIEVKIKRNTVPTTFRLKVVESWDVWI
jgi:hypothetical protein